MNDAEFGRAIHERLLDGDPVAPEELCSRWLEPLVGELSRAFPAVAQSDEALIVDAVVDALLKYIERPSIFQPQRSPLRQFLYFAAKGDLLNTLQRRRRRAAREQPVESVEDWARRRNDKEKGGKSVEELALSAESAAAWQEALARHFPDERDGRMIELMLAGERQTARYAEVLGIGHLDEVSQRREVKRQKDRIGKRLRRLGEKLREQG